MEHDDVGLYFYIMMMQQSIEAKDLKVGMQYASSGTIQEVKEIVKVTDKTIEFRTKRIFPDIYDGNFFQRKSLTTKISLTKF